MRTLKALILILGVYPLIPGGGVAGQDPDPVAHAVIFYHPGCPHCRQLINEHLIPLQNQYGDRLVLLAMDTSQEWANNLYWEAILRYELPEEDWVVPILIVGDEVMVGGNEIPARLPGIIDAGLASGGIDLPDFPALLTFLREQDALDVRYPNRRIVRRPESSGTGTPAEDPPESGQPEEVAAGVGAPAPEVLEGEDTVEVGRSEETGQPESVSGVAPSPPMDSRPPDSMAASRAQAPPEGRSGSEVQGRLGASDSERSSGSRPSSGSTGSGVGPMDLEGAARGMESMTMWARFNLDRAGNSLSLLVLVLMAVSLGLRGYPPKIRARGWPEWVLPVLVLVGLVVAAYLSFIEVTRAEAVCGPVGDCNTVNQSGYALLFGVLPVGVLGLFGYGLILLFWLVRRTASPSAHRWATLGLWAGAVLGTLFSVYLTFLEPFVIGATCIWCLTSAMVMTLLLWTTAPWASRVWVRPRRPGTARVGAS